MKKFLRFLVGVCLIFIVVLIILDLSYTAVFTYCPPRTKIAYIMKLKPQKIARVFLGSSRVANHIVTKEVERNTGEKAMNLGIEGAYLPSSLLEFKLLLSRKISVEKLYLQVDDNFNFENLGVIGTTAALPFIKDPAISEFMECRLDNYWMHANIPFYRYAINDQVLGLREVILSLMKNKPSVAFTDGYYPQIGNHKLEPYILPDKIAIENATILEFQQLCRKNNIQLIIFCAPYSSKLENRAFLSSLKNKIAGFRDYSAAIPDSLFYNSRHLNSKGALEFTRLIISE